MLSFEEYSTSACIFPAVMTIGQKRWIRGYVQNCEIGSWDRLSF